MNEPDPAPLLSRGPDVLAVSLLPDGLDGRCRTA